MAVKGSRMWVAVCATVEALHSMRQGFAQDLVLHLFTCPCRMQIYLACTMLDTERYESRAVNDRLNECEAQARFAK